MSPAWQAIVIVWAIVATYAALRLHGLLVDAERDADTALDLTADAVRLMNDARRLRE